MNEHPVTLHVMDDLRRSRLTVFFRPLLAIPHFIWVDALGHRNIDRLHPQLDSRARSSDDPASPFQRFNAAFLRYTTTVYAYPLLIANPFPGFTGEPGSYPIEAEVPTEPEKQSRLKTFFRILLAYPASSVSGVLLVGHLRGYVPCLVGGIDHRADATRLPRSQCQHTSLHDSDQRLYVLGNRPLPELKPVRGHVVRSTGSSGGARGAVRSVTKSSRRLLGLLIFGALASGWIWAAPASGRPRFPPT